MTKEISLTQGKVALVDDEDFDYLSQYKWCAHKGRNNIFYAVRNVRNKKGATMFKMHSVIIGTPSGMDTDHINGDGLDNRKTNLRVVTRRQNIQNLHIPKSSKYPGVTWNKNTRKWRALIRISDRLCHLGLFTDEDEAAEAYVIACADISKVVIPPTRKRLSRFKGVVFDKGRNKWRADMRVNNKMYYLGRYADEETAGTVVTVARCHLDRTCRIKPEPPVEKAEPSFGFL